MTLNFVVPDRYSYVLLTAVGTGWLTVWQTILVGRSRKRAQIPYPEVYAEKAQAEKSLDAMKFNCAQRAHQNTLEMLPQVLLYLAVSGLKYPTLTASFGAAWLVGRVAYTLGYVTGDPNKRYPGVFGNIGVFGLLLTTTWSVGELVYATL